MSAQEDVDMNAVEGKGKGARARKRTAAKAPAESGKRSLNLRIDEESYRRLSIHALMRPTHTTISDLVMEYASTLREYSMPHRIGGGPGKGEQGE